MARLASAHLREAGVDPAPLLLRAGISASLLEDSDAEVAAIAQVAFLNLAAAALRQNLLGFNLARTFELRQIGLLYYVLASSDVLGDAFARVARYSVIANESVAVSHAPDDAAVRLRYVGIPRQASRHQTEFWITALVRICWHLTGSRPVPIRIALNHPRLADSSALEKFFECPVLFDADVDEFEFPREALELRLRNADPYLNKLLVRNCEEAVARRPRPGRGLRSRVEHAVAPLLPHGRARVEDVARNLGMSRRTLARHLADEGLTFSDILENLRMEMARRYLDDPGLPISRIAWLLGYQETSAFTNSFKRWTGLTPTAMRRHSGLAATGGK